MPLLIAIRIAIVALARNKLRTALTTLGITVGVAAVICTVALGEGSTRQIQRQLLEVGDYFVWIENGSRNVGGVRTGAGGTRGVTVADMLAVKEGVQDIKACTAQVDSRVQVVFGNQNWSTTYRGVSPEFLSIRRWSLASGSMFSDADVEARSAVLVLGSVVREQLFGDQDPIGQTVRVRQVPFRVIGVLRSKGSSTGGQDQDDQILLPYTTAQRKIRGISWLDDFMCSVTSPEVLPEARDAIIALMRQRHRIPPDGPDDFNVRDPTEMLQLREETTRLMGLFLSAVASISLLVGGIGVMNIMLVSVTERTREIGLRMATGARAADIRRQFLAEAVALALAGGIAGVGLGMAASQVLADSAGWPMVVTPATIAVATGVASVIGIVFGYFPARRAAQLDPIEALRSE